MRSYAPGVSQHPSPVQTETVSVYAGFSGWIEEYFGMDEPVP